VPPETGGIDESICRVIVVRFRVRCAVGGALRTLRRFKSRVHLRLLNRGSIFSETTCDHPAIKGGVIACELRDGNRICGTRVDVDDRPTLARVIRVEDSPAPKPLVKEALDPILQAELTALLGATPGNGRPGRGRRSVSRAWA